MLCRGAAMPLRLCVVACLTLLAMTLLAATSDAAPLALDAHEQQLTTRDVIEVAKKSSRKTRKSRAAETEDASAPRWVPGPDDKLVTGDAAEALIKPLTPAASYRSGQSVFFEIRVRRRKGARAKTAGLELGGAGVTVAATAPNGVTVKTSNGKVVLTFPLTRGSGVVINVEARLVGAAQTASPQSPVSQLRLALHAGKEPTKTTDAVLSFPLADCATAYHRALGDLYVGRQAAFADIVRSASRADESLPGAWLFPPRKLSNAELQPKQAVLLPPRRECRWAVETVSFSTRKSERLCKRWELVEVAVDQQGPRIPEVDEVIAARLNKLAFAAIQNRGGIAAFGKSGKLEWVSKRILADLKGYLQQGLHPALCTGVDVMTAYFHDHSVTLRKELAASTESLGAARQIAATRLQALAMVLGRQSELPAETASLSLIAPANAVSENGQTSDRLIAEAGRLLLTDQERGVLAASGGPMAMLSKLRAQLGEDAGHGKPAEVLPYLADALTAVEAAAYLEATDTRYQRIDEAIFGTISAIEKAHGRTCDCAP